MRMLMAAVVVPPLTVFAAAMTHPSSLTLESAQHWKEMHVFLLFFFPLLALGPWLVAREVDRRAGWLVGVVAYVYATCYTALDIIGGIAAGALKEAEAGGLGIIFPIAGDFEQIGGIALVLASALAAGVAMNRTGWVLGALPSLAVVIGSIGLWQQHIFRPWGPISMVLLALGWAAFVVLLQQGERKTVRLAEPSR